MADTSMRRAILSGWLYLPYEAVADMVALRKALTIPQRPTMDGNRRPPIHLFLDLPDRRMVGVPSAWGRHVYPWLEVDDRRTDGEAMGPIPRLPTPDHPAVKEPEAQRKFMADLDDAVGQVRTFLVKSPTGSGKSVVALRSAAVRGRRTCVLVPMARLQAQWVQEIQDKLGLPPGRVGMAGGEYHDYEGKDFVVAMMQSLALEPGRYGKEFYQSFGTVIYDEVHRYGAAVMQQVMFQFPAAVQFGMSATVDGRKDQGAKVFYWHLGRVAVQSEQAALPLQVWPRWYDCGTHRLWGTTHGARIKCLSMDHNRNALIVKMVQRMHEAGRNYLVVAEGIDHLQHLMAMAQRAGVPADSMGQFTNKVRYVENVRAGDRVQAVRKERVQRAAVLERIKRESRGIFATYGMIKEAIDIPRLDAGIDATPRSDAAQLIGRLRRPHEGKKSPVLWVTIVDNKCDRSLRYFQARMAEYKATGAEVVDGIG